MSRLFLITGIFSVLAGAVVFLLGLPFEKDLIHSSFIQKEDGYLLMVILNIATLLSTSGWIISQKEVKKFFSYEIFLELALIMVIKLILGIILLYFFPSLSSNNIFTFIIAMITILGSIFFILSFTIMFFTVRKIKKI